MMTSPTIEVRVAALLEVLDEDIRHIETTLRRLDTLRTLLVKRDDAALEGLLGEIQAQAQARAANDRKRQLLRQELAAEMRRPERDLTLSELQNLLDGQSRRALRERQVRLKFLIGQLQREYTLTAMLLSDCARLNRSLIQAVFGLGENGSVTYSPSGAARTQRRTGLVSLQL